MDSNVHIKYSPTSQSQIADQADQPDEKEIGKCNAESIPLLGFISSRLVGLV